MGTIVTTPVYNVVEGDSRFLWESHITLIGKRGGYEESGRGLNVTAVPSVCHSSFCHEPFETPRLEFCGRRVVTGRGGFVIGEWKDLSRVVSYKPATHPGVFVVVCRRRSPRTTRHGGRPSVCPRGFSFLSFCVS